MAHTDPQLTDDDLELINAVGEIKDRLRLAHKTSAWERVAGTPYFTKQGEDHIYEQISGQLFLRLGEGAVRAWQAGSYSPPAEQDVNAEQEAERILARIDRGLALEEERADRLLRHYGLA